RQHWLTTRADAFCRRFFELLEQDKPHAAHQLRERPGVRKPLVEGLAEAYERDPESKERFDQFIQEKPVAALLDEQGPVTIELRGAEVRASDFSGDQLALRYRISPDTPQDAIEVQMLVRRGADSGAGRENWFIEAMQME